MMQTETRRNARQPSRMNRWPAMMLVHGTYLLVRNQQARSERAYNYDMYVPLKCIAHTINQDINTAHNSTRVDEGRKELKSSRDKNARHEP